MNSSVLDRSIRGSRVRILGVGCLVQRTAEGGASSALGPKPPRPGTVPSFPRPPPPPTAFPGQAAPPEGPWAQLEPAASASIPLGEGHLPVARHPGSAQHLSSHAVRTTLSAPAAPAGDACPDPCVVTAPVVPGRAGLTALGVPAQRPGWLRGQPGLFWPLVRPGDEPHLPRGRGHTHHYRDAGDQPEGAAVAPPTGQ